MATSSSAQSSPSRTKVRIKTAELADVPAIQEIYAHYVLNSTSSFEEEAPTVAEMTARWQKLKVMNMPFLVAFVGKRIAGYAYGGPYRDRSAYRYTIEDSIYIAPDMLGRGVGNALMTELIKRSTNLGYRQMIAVIGDSTNAASLALHSRHGFWVIGALSSSGFKFGRWADAVLMQRTLGEGDTTVPPLPPGQRKRKRAK